MTGEEKRSILVVDDDETEDARRILLSIRKRL